MNAQISPNPSNFQIVTTNFLDLAIIKRGVHNDNRGMFEKPFIGSEFKNNLSFGELQEVNISVTRETGTIRGFHHQIAEASETKIVTCVSGAIFDCVLDLRPNSETFGGVFTIELSAKSGLSIVVPKGFAHGFQSLEDETIVLYCVDSPYAPKSQNGINPMSSELQSIWPLEVTCISEQDTNLPLWSEEISVAPWRP